MKKKFADIWDTVKTKAVLFRIWFFKNITVFAYIALIVIITLVACGAIPNDFAILGEMSSIINDLYAVNSVGAAAKWAVSTLSATSIVFIFCTYARRIGMTDITSDRVKLMFIKAGLCFDDKGYLVTRKKYDEEKAKSSASASTATTASTTTTTTDSATIGDVIASPVKAVQEFVTITSAEVDHDATLTAENSDSVNEDEAEEATNAQAETADSLTTTKKKHTYEKVFGMVKNTLFFWKKSAKELVSKDKTATDASTDPTSAVSVIKSSKSVKASQKASQTTKSLNPNQSVAVTFSEKMENAVSKILPKKEESKAVVQPVAAQPADSFEAQMQKAIGAKPVQTHTASKSILDDVKSTFGK